MPRGHNLEPETIQRINEMLDKDITHKCIADQLGISSAAVSRLSALRRSKPLEDVRSDKWAIDLRREWDETVKRIKDQCGVKSPSRDYIAEGAGGQNG